MSVLLNITMPKTCEVCPCNDDNWRCGATEEYFDYDDMRERRRDDCPLVEIPTPHGRLIDADAHILEIRKQYCEDCLRRKGIKNGKMKFLYEIGGVVCRACEIEDMLNALDDAQTVIEAEGREE